MKIRAARINTDFAQIRLCIVELQDYEREIDPRMPTGESIADAYLEEMLGKCKEHDGQIFMSEIDGEIAGYVTILGNVRSGNLDDGHLEYSCIDDLIVREQFRRNGVGMKIVETAELFTKSKNARWMRLSVLARNTSARKLYSSSGFSELYIDYEKGLSEDS